MKTPIYQIAILFLILSTLNSFGQKTQPTYLLAFSDSSSGKELWGFKTTSGQIVIKPKYENILGADTVYSIAFVTLNSKWITINKRDSLVLTPYVIDNGPDYMQEGLFRFVENSKIGFANSTGQKKIAARFDFALPFSDGLAAFSVGGSTVKLDDEHSIRRGGLWGFMNKKGGIVIKPQFVKTYSFNRSTCEVWTKNNKHTLIDKKGRVLKILPN